MTKHSNGSGLSIDRDALSEDVYTAVFDADAPAREAIAGRLGLQSLGALHATFGLTAMRDGSILVEGRLRAEGEQTCVVTLEPVPMTVDCTFSGVCVPSDSAELQRDDVTLEDDEVEILGEIVDDSVDLAEIAVQQLALELDPFPRSEGAETATGQPSAELEEDHADSPFAALEALKKTLK